MLRSSKLPLVLLCSGFVAGSFCLRAQDAAEKKNFVTTLRKDFATWDLDHDGILSQKEIDAAVNNAKTTKEDAAAAAALKRATHAPKTPLPPLTLENLVTLAQQRKPNFELLFSQGLKTISSGADRALFPNGLPAIETVHQGRLGNCFCLAPLGALLHRDPAQVASMFTLQGNGKYQVHFGKKTVEVAPPTDAELAMGVTNGNGGLWVNIYEKAIGTALNEDRPADKRVDSPFDAERGGSAGTMLAYITGHPITRFSFKFAKTQGAEAPDFAAKLADLRSQLTEAQKQNRLMTTGTEKTTTPGLTPNHAYAVLGYDAASDSVSLWNPHGQVFHPTGAAGAETGFSTENGKFQVPVDLFVRLFSGMAFEITTPESGAPVAEKSSAAAATSEP